MGINERIEKIKPYFVSFNVMASEGASYVLINLPLKWQLPDTAQLKKIFKCEIVRKEEGVYIVTELENDTELLFNAADYIIDFNKNLEIRTQLLNEKIKELREIFATETIEKIKRLEFTFPGAPKGKNKGKTVEPKPTVEEIQEEEVEEENVEQPIGAQAEENNEESSLFEMAKELTGEE